MRHLNLPLFAALLLMLSCGDSRNDTPAEATAITTDTVPTYDATDALSRYDVEQYFPGDMKDTLLTNMITFIYKRPVASTQKTRTNPEFRSYFVKHINLFQYAYHGIGPDSAHYFYLVRPARSVEGTLRGVGGRFTTDGKLGLVEFEELFNTRISTRDELLRHGERFMQEVLATGKADSIIADREVTEWPDDRLKYHLELREWRYVD